MYFIFCLNAPKKPLYWGEVSDSKLEYSVIYELFSTTFGKIQTTDRQKVKHMSPPCKLHGWAKKFTDIVEVQHIVLHKHALLQCVNVSVSVLC